MSWACAGCVLGVLCRERGPQPWCPVTSSFPEINDWEGVLRTRIPDSPPSGKIQEKPSAVDSSLLRTTLCSLSKEGPQPRPHTWRRGEAYTRPLAPLLECSAPLSRVYSLLKGHFFLFHYMQNRGKFEMSVYQRSMLQLPGTN